MKLKDLYELETKWRLTKRDPSFNGHASLASNEKPLLIVWDTEHKIFQVLDIGPTDEIERFEQFPTAREVVDFVTKHYNISIDMDTMSQLVE